MDKTCFGKASSLKVSLGANSKCSSEDCVGDSEGKLVP